MKLTKQSNRIKSRIVSFTIAIALILCAVLSLGYILPDRIARAEDGPSTPAAKVTDGIRFVQVAAGYDFAIGLTYDRKLYGWSTKDERNTSDMQSLGDYYTYNPTEIKVTFRKGPSGSFRWGDTGDTNNNYHTPRTDDQIKSIAATGTTAAFVTEKGFLYTWGMDTYDVAHNEGSNPNYLLLRTTDESKEYSWKVPYIINYHYYGETASNVTGPNKNPLEQLIPSKDDGLTSLAAGEYNYIFMFERSYPATGTSGWGTPGDYYHTYVWGSLLYNAANTSDNSEFEYTSPIDLQSGANARKVFNTFVSTSNKTMSVVAGGYTVGINNASRAISSTSSFNSGTTLQLHGKNFITTQPVTSSGDDYNVVNTANLVSPTTDAANTTFGSAAGATPGAATADIVYTPTAGNSVKYKNAIAGGNGSGGQDGQLVGRNTERFYARQAGSYTYSISANNEAGYLINSKASDNLISKYGDDQTALKPTRYAVALGNDIGYGISGGKLFGWGDNANGQITPGTNGTYNGDPTAILSTVNFTSVAAGKQKSPDNGDRAFFNNSDTIGGSAFAAKYQNDDKYITGALTTDGTIYAWSKGIEAKELRYVGDPTNPAAKKESFAAVYSGYGEILYAVTASGKLVRITKNEAGTNFEQYVYDEFYSRNSQGAAQKIENWSVDKTNKVVFNVPTSTEVAPDLGHATFYVWSAATSVTAAAEGEEAPESTVKINGGSQAAYKPLVSDNKIGDAYRIVGLTASDANIKYLKAGDKYQPETGTAFNNLDVSNYAPKFYFGSNENGTGGTLMELAQQQNMFTFREVYGENGEGVGIYIEPKQSSKGQNIRVDFYIARYNSYGKYNATSATSNQYNATDNAIYYDYKQCSIIFKIADTPSVKTYAAHITDSDNRAINSNVPLLDPNNPYNTNFSLAVQDVSGGVDELIKFLTGNSESVNGDFKDAVIAQMQQKDAGFPASSKVTSGNLSYYLNATDLAKYDNTYRFLFTDRDSDRVTLARYNETDPIISEGIGVTGDIKNITVTVPYTDYLAGSLSSLTSAELLKKINTDFDNRYGLYDFSIDASNNLVFKYDVILFTATGQSGVIRYSGDSSAATRVNGYITGAGSDAARASFYANTLNDYTYDAVKGYSSSNKTAPRITASNMVYVYSKPTLRLKSDLNGATEVVDVNGQVLGTKNTFTKNFTDELFVGDSTEILLSDYVKFASDAYISFTYKNSTAAAVLKQFSDQFTDNTGHIDNGDDTARAGARVVWLEGNKITVHPTTASPINFTVAVQRFADSERSKYFTYDNNADNADEKIFLTFNFTNIVGFNIKKHSSSSDYLIKETTTLDLFSGSNRLIDLESTKSGSNISEGALAALQANARIYDLKSSGSQLFTAVADNTKITLTPIQSGTGTIQFTVNIYDKSETFILTINVSSKTEMSTVTIIDTLSIPISDLSKALIDANSFNADARGGYYKILFNATNNSDTKDAIYFTSDASDGNPPFVQSVVFEKVTSTEPTLRIIPSNNTVVKRDIYYMHVKFVNTKDTNYTSYENVPERDTIEIIIPVVSGKIKLQDKGVDLVAEINCRNHKNSQLVSTTGEKLETKATIPLSYLLDCAGTEEPESYKIFLVSADSNAAKYFQYDKGEGDSVIIITPKDNTPKNFELSVSAYSGTTTTVLTFEVSIKGILTELPVMTNDDGIIGYGNIWLYSAAIVFGVLFIIFMIRFIVYMRRRSKQRAIIKRNQELIRLRDRMHGKANAASREQLVKSKLKMEDPKYAKMFNDMRRDKEEESGVALVNSDLAATADKKTKKKKKGGKKSVADLKAELAAKKAAFAAAQAGNAQPVNPFATEVPLDGGFVAPDGGYAPDGGFADGGGFAADGGFADGGGDYGAQSIDGSEIVFDASDMGDGNM